MPRDPRTNIEFQTALLRLYPKSPDALTEIADVLGAEEFEELNTITEYPIAGFYIEKTQDNVTRIYILTPEKICMYERNQEGHSFSSVSPIERIKRVTQSSNDSGYSLTFEIDAGQIVTIENGLYQNINEPGVARTESTSVSNPWGYTITTNSNGKELKEFARTVRNVLGY